MKRMTNLLRAARFVCGDDASARVIEPLLADWQRELQLARRQGTFAYAAIAASGAGALARSLLACAITESLWIPPLRGAMFSLLAIAFTVSASVLVLMIPAVPRTERSLADPLMQRWLLVMSSTVLPPSFLLAMFMQRRDPRATVRHAVIGLSLVAIAMTALTVTTNPDTLRRRYSTFEFQERLRARMLIEAQSHPDIYRGRALEQTLATTVEQRRAIYDRMQARFAEFRKNDPPQTFAERFAQWQPVMLSVVFAVMGWMLGGMGDATISRGLIWWSLVFLATIAMTPLLSLLVGVPMPRPAQWWMLPMFTSMTLALVVAARTNRRSSIRGES